MKYSTYDATVMRQLADFLETMAFWEEMVYFHSLSDKINFSVDLQNH